MTKHILATQIERHHLYSPMAKGVYSKKYYSYSSSHEVDLLMKLTKNELEDIYNMLYSSNGRELTNHEINY